jgi:arginyl-tRNA synthetase
MSKDYFPHVLCQYVYDMTKKFSSFYNNIQILSENDEQLKQSRLALLA